MNQDSIVFALSNPEPEILPCDALEGGARIVITGRSDLQTKLITQWYFRQCYEHY